jgi:ABC-type transport system involved in cytochrome bd biosynthesis fused ATPase/permease subunit
LSAPAPRPVGARRAVVRIVREAQRAGGGGALILASLVAAAANGSVVLPLFMQRVTEGLVVRQGSAVLPMLAAIAGAALLLGYSAEWMANRLAARLNQRICGALIDRQLAGQLRGELGDFLRHGTGAHAAAVGEVAETLQAHQLFVLQGGILSAAVTVLGIAILAAYDPWFLAVTLPFMTAICCLPMLLASRANAHIQREPAAFGALATGLGTLVEGRRQWHFGARPSLVAHADALLAGLHRQQAGKWLIWNLSFNLKLTQNLILYAVTLLVAGLLYLEGRIGIDRATGAYLLVTMLAPRFDTLYKLYNFAQVCGASYDALDAARLSPRARSRAVPPALSIKSLAIEVSSGEGLPFGQASLHLRAGDRCLIAGPSGTGKSTLLDLIIGLRRAPGAAVRIDDRPLDDDLREGLWRALAYVGAPDLFDPDRSAADNLAWFGDPAAPGLADWQAALGWSRFADTPAGHLSGGEVQRLSLLRALSRQRPLMVLDEPTSALDERSIHVALDLLVRRPTPGILIVASHSAAIERHFTHVFDLKDGRLERRAC